MPRFPSLRAQQAHIGAARDELLDQLQVGRVVLYIEQGAQRRIRARTCAGAIAAGSALSSCKFWRSSRVQFEPEHASHPDSAFHADHASHQFNQPLAHHQADARAFLRAPVSCPRRLNGWKSCVSISGGNPAPVSLTLTRMRSGVLAVHVHDDRSIRLVVFDRVGKKVDENLLQAGSDRH